MDISTLFSIIILIFSVVVHEVSHGLAALYLGDPTAKLDGRLTLNPIKHIDPFGSVILPLMMVVLNTGIVFGWAKPVPYNPYNLRGGKWGPAIVAIAGPLSNILIALVFGLFVRFGLAPFMDPAALAITGYIVLINLVLAVFNLIPLPPLDGSKILFALLPYRFRGVEEWLNRYQLFLFVLVILVISEIVGPIAMFLFRLITGLPF